MTSPVCSKVKSICEDLNIKETDCAMTLYLYLTYCLQEVLIDGSSNTIFGKLTLDENNRLNLETDKFGLIGLLNKHDYKIIRKIVEEGPDTKIFEL